MTLKSNHLKKLKKAAKLGDATAQFELAEHLWFKTDSKNNQIAAGLYRAAAEQGHLEAQYTLANLFHVYPREYIGEDESIEWFKKAAAHGHINSMFELGCCYSHGMYMDPVMEEAVKWFQLAADRGHAGAQYELGIHYGKVKNHEKSIEWFKKAVAQKHTEARYELALCYLRGEGGGPDADKEAFKLLRLAGMRSHPCAQYVIGCLYSEGKVVWKNDRLALKWWLKAAKRWHPDAQEQVRLSYVLGRGTKMDRAMADKWYKIISERDIPQANPLKFMLPVKID